MSDPDDLSVCPICGRDACEDHYPPDPSAAPRRGLANLQDASTVIAEGKRIAAAGIRYTVDGIIPNYGMLGMLVAYAKVGKTTLGQALAAAVAMGTPFLERVTTQTRVLVIAAEDPPEYTAYLARHLTVEPGRLTFYRAPVLLNPTGLRAISETITDGRYGLVLISSWQAVIRGQVRDENDNAGAVHVVEAVKAATRVTEIPWLIDAHAGKGENQDDDADPTKALRGASAAAGAADYLLSLRYANGAFGNQRRFSGKGRFVNLAPLTLEYDLATGCYVSLGDTKNAARETTWQLLVESKAIDQTPRSLTELARRSGLVPENGRLSGGMREHLGGVLGRPAVGRADELRRGQKTALYRLLSVM